MDIFDDIFDSKPSEHLVKILQNAAPSAIENALNQFFNEYAILHAMIEENGLTEQIPDYKNKLKNELESLRQDISIRLMSDILSQGDS